MRRGKMAIYRDGTKKDLPSGRDVRSRARILRSSNEASLMASVATP